MKKILPLLLLLFAYAFNLFSAEIVTKSGPVILEKFGHSCSDSQTTIKAGNIVTVEIPLCIGTFFDDLVVYGNGKIKNTTDKYQQSVYIVSFYDENSELISAVSANFDLDPNLDTWFGSAMVKGEEENFKKIRSYKFEMYTFEIPAGE